MPFHVFESSPDVCWHYGDAYRHLARNGTSIGTNDLWIAATALARGMLIVTRDAEHFSRVPSLGPVEYVG